jgi:hypothetical protein
VIRFAADENLNDLIVRALRRRRPDIDLVRVRDTEMRGANDPELLDWAARERRVILTHDVTTMTKHAYERVRTGQPMAGVFEVPSTAAVSIVIDDLILLADCSFEGEWAGQVRYLPLR